MYLNKDIIEVNCNKAHHQKSASVVLKEGSETLHRIQKSNSGFHPLSVEYLTGGVDHQANDSCSSSTFSDTASETSVRKCKKNDRKAVNSVPGICFLIDTVKESVVEIEKDFQSDIGKLSIF